MTKVDRLRRQIADLELKRDAVIEKLTRDETDLRRQLADAMKEQHS